MLRRFNGENISGGPPRSPLYRDHRRTMSSRMVMGPWCIMLIIRSKPRLLRRLSMKLIVSRPHRFSVAFVFMSGKILRAIQRLSWQKFTFIPLRRRIKIMVIFLLFVISSRVMVLLVRRRMVFQKLTLKFLSVLSIMLLLLVKRRKRFILPVAVRKANRVVLASLKLVKVKLKMVMVPRVFLVKINRRLILMKLPNLRKLFRRTSRLPLLVLVMVSISLFVSLLVKPRLLVVLKKPIVVRLIFIQQRMGSFSRFKSGRTRLMSMAAKPLKFMVRFLKKPKRVLRVARARRILILIIARLLLLSLAKSWSRTSLILTSVILRSF